MTKEEKQLLLKDLCARLPYNPYILIEGERRTVLSSITIYQDEYAEIWYEGIYYDIEDCKPYLRPMSSMTEDEREEIEVLIFNEWYQEDSCKIDKEGWIEILANYDVSGIDPCFCSDYVDWLNAHHFDYRGLIPKGLALEATEGMYETK